MATGKNGTFIINNTASSGLPMGACRFTWEETYDVSSNTSTVKITKMEMLCAGDGQQNRNYGFGPLWFLGTLDAYAAVTINGTVAATVPQRNNNFVLSNPVYGAYADVSIAAPALPWQTTVAHNSDGTKSVTVTVGLFANASSGNALTNTNISGSTTVELTTIPRTSTVTAPNGNIGSAMTITINRASSSFTHTLTYKFGSATGTIATKTTAASVSWTPPTSLYAQVPSATSGSCTITCETFSGNTSVGTTTKTITLSVPASVKPTVSSGWAAVSWDNGSVSVAKWIQGYSKAKVTFDPSKVTAGSGSSIKSYSISYGGKTYAASSNVATTPVLTTAGEQSITATVTDQRGRTATAALTITVLSYAKPTLSKPTAYRSDEYGAASESGLSYTAKTGISYSSLDGANRVNIYFRHKVSGGSFGGASTMTANTAETVSGLTLTNTYIVEIYATDTVGNRTSTSITIPTAAIAMNLRRNHDGVAFGKYSEHEKALELPADWNITIGGTGVFEHDNILDNPYLIVNQRGFTSGSVTTTTFVADRWQPQNGAAYLTITRKTNGGISVKNTASGTGVSIAQKIESDRLTDGVYTISMIGTFNGNFSFRIYDETSSTFLHNGNQFLAKTGLNSETFSLSGVTPGHVLRVLFYTWTGDFSLDAAKLERGYVSTLLNDSVPNYAAELLKCQRYYVRFSRYVASGIVTNSQKTYYMPVNLPSVMRTTPSVASTGWRGRTASGYSAHSGSSYVSFEDISVSNFNGNYVSVVDSIATGADTNNTVVAFEINNLEFSADL